MKQDLLIAILKNAFEEGWHERNRRVDDGNKLTYIPVDDDYIVAQERTINRWLKELSSTVEF